MLNVDTPNGPAVLLPYRITIDERVTEPGWHVMVEYPDGHRRVWRLDQIQAQPHKNGQDG